MSVIMSLQVADCKFTCLDTHSQDRKHAGMHTYACTNAKKVEGQRRHSSSGWQTNRESGRNETTAEMQRHNEQVQETEKLGLEVRPLGKGWEMDWPTDESSDEESESSSAFGDGHYRFKPRTPKIAAPTPPCQSTSEVKLDGGQPREGVDDATENATENDFTVASNGFRISRRLVNKV